MGLKDTVAHLRAQGAYRRNHLNGVDRVKAVVSHLLQGQVHQSVEVPSRLD